MPRDCPGKARNHRRKPFQCTDGRPGTAQRPCPPSKAGAASPQKHARHHRPALCEPQPSAPGTPREPRPSGTDSPTATPGKHGHAEGWLAEAGGCPWHHGELRAFMFPAWGWEGTPHHIRPSVTPAAERKELGSSAETTGIAAKRKGCGPSPGRMMLDGLSDQASQFKVLKAALCHHTRVPSCKCQTSPDHGKQSSPCAQCTARTPDVAAAADGQGTARCGCSGWGSRKRPQGAGPAGPGNRSPAEAEELARVQGAGVCLHVSGSHVRAAYEWFWGETADTQRCPFAVSPPKSQGHRGLVRS